MTERVLPTSQSSNLPTFKISSDGTDLDGTFNVLSIQVDRAVNRISTAHITLSDGSAAREDFDLSNRDELAPGAVIEIAAGYHNENETIFKGLVIKQSLHVKRDRCSTLVVECKDPAYAMTVGRHNRYFTDSTDQQAVEEVVDAHGLDHDVEAMTVEHGSLVQYNTSDWDFVLTRAEANGKLVFLRNGPVSVAAPDLSADPAVALLYGATILSLDLSLDASHQHDSVTCAAWDPAGQEVAEAEASSTGLVEAGNLSSGALAGRVTSGETRHQHHGRLAPGELQAWADARRVKNTLAKIRGTVKAKGLATVEPGVVVELAGVGDRFNGNVFVSAVRHALHDGAWEMHLEVGLSPEPFTRAADVTDAAAGGLVPSVGGLQIGVVTQLQDDPDGEHRVLVRMPVVDAEAEGTSARVATLDAGENRGSFFLPDIGDEVVLGFLEDDPRQPIVLGMFNSSSKPAPKDASDDNHVKGYYSREALKLVFDDEVKSITLETPEGNSIVLDEDAGGITIKDQNDNSIVMSSDGITISTPGTLAMSADGDVTVSGTNVELSAQATFKASGSSGTEVSSSGSTDVKGSIVNIN